MQPRAVAVVRNGFVYDARVLREVRTLQEIGYRPLVVAARTPPELAPSETLDGLTVVRVAASAPVAWIQRTFAPRTGSPELRRHVDARSRGPRSTAARIALRGFRWIRTLDYYARTIRIVLAERPTLVHCNDHNTMWIGIAAKLVARSRVIYDAHELWPDRNGRWEWRPWLLATEALFTHVADEVVVASPGFVEPMRRRYRIATPRVVRNVPDRRGPSPATRSSEQPVAAYVGALIDGRGLERAIEAVARIPGLQLRLIGHGAPSMIAALRAHAKAVGAGERLEIRPPVAPDRVVDALAGASVGLSLFQPICLSHQLTLPNKLFEYVAAGLPILASDMLVSAEFVRTHQIGEVVVADDPPAIAEGLERLLDPRRTEALRDRLRRAARELSWERERELLVEAYAAATA